MKKVFIPSLVVIISITILHEINAYAQDTTFKFQQQDDGFILMEAENFNERVQQDSISYWSLNNNKGVVQANIKENGLIYNNIIEAGQNAAYLTYNINFVKTGKHYIWVRASSQ